MRSPLCDFLVTGQRYFGRYDASRGEVFVLDQDKGPYYGISWSSKACFVLARNRGKGELILVFDPGGSLIKIIHVGRDIDGHQIHFSNQQLHLTATRENALVLLDPDTEAQSIWNWTGYTKDINHINGIGAAGDGHLWVSHDNRRGTPSEIVRLSLQTREVDGRVQVDGPMNGTHNIEDDVVVSSGDISSLWDISDIEGPRKVFALPSAFCRGLARHEQAGGEEHLLLGASPLLARDQRGLPNPCFVQLVSRHDWTPKGRLTIPDIGQIHDLRIPGPACTHNGLPFPGDLRSWSGAGIISTTLVTDQNNLPTT